MTELSASTLEQVRARSTGPFLLPGDDGWDDVRGAFNLAVDQRPAAIALPRNEADVALAVELAAGHGLRVGVQRTGHNAAPLGPLEEALLVRTEGLEGVEVDASARSARVGAGAKWADLVPQAAEAGLAALHGSSPTVGIVGYSLGGGLGWYGRRHGLQANSVTAVELVTADGAHRRVDASDDSGLFWALRGGAGNLGVVTALEFSLYPVEEVYAGILFFPFERADEVLHAWHEWLAGVPEEATSIGRLLQFPPVPQVPEPMRGNSFAVVEAVFLGAEADGIELLRPLRELGPAIDTFAMTPPSGLGGLHMDPPHPVPFVSGHRLLADEPPGLIDALLAAAGPGSGSPLLSVELRHLGGALARSAPGHGAIASLAGEYLLFAVGSAMDDDAAAAMRAHVEVLDAAVAPYAAGLFANFTETRGDGSRFFAAETYERLRAVKAAVDPAGLFQATFEIPPA